MHGAVVIGLFYTYFSTIQAVTAVKGSTDYYDTEEEVPKFLL
jgi:hypothetical protein